MPTTKSAYLSVFTPAVLLLALSASLPATALTKLVWANTDSDMLAAESWTNGIAPNADSVLIFDSTAVVQPVLTGSLTVTGVTFGQLGSSYVPVSANDGMEGFNYGGYHITGEPGAVLTCKDNSYNNGTTRAFNHSSFATNVVDVPVVFVSGSAATMVTGGRLEFRKPVSAAASVTLTCTGQNYGETVFCTANPDFTPKTFALDGSATIVLEAPDAFANVKAFTTKCVYQYPTANGFPNAVACRLFNRSGETARFSAATFAIANTADVVLGGDPFDFSETVWTDDLYDSKPHHFETTVTVKNLSYTGGTTGIRDFKVAGEGTIHNLGAFFTNTTVSTRLHIAGGCYVGWGENARPDAAVLMSIDDKNTGPSIYGLSEDFEQTLVGEANRDPGIFYFNNSNNNRGGFAAFGADRHVKLYGGETLVCPTAYGTFTAYKVPYRFAFGAADADAAVILENDIDFYADNANSDRGVFVRDGPAAVEVRFAGTVTNSKTLKIPFVKLGPGALALDGEVFLTGAGRVEEGGLLVNDKSAGSFTVWDGARLGGTGEIAGAVAVKTGGAIGGGEGGSGVLTLSGGATLESGAAINVEIGEDGSAGCIALGAGAAWSQEGTATIRVRLASGDVSPRRGRMKILDWSASPDAAVPDVDSFVFDFDSEILLPPRLYRTDDALYLRYAFAAESGMVLIVR